jgi:hypothetical protein
MKPIALLATLSAACAPAVHSDAMAELAYVDLDGAVGRGLSLGMDGYNSASSANIEDQEAEGDTSGTMVISGQVDQGESDNKGLRLFMTLTEYSDTLADDNEPDVLYDTDPAAPAALTLSLRNIPDGTIDGTIVGDFAMDGALAGVVALDLTLSGTLELVSDDDTAIQRVDGSTTITGTATSDYGVYDVDVTL